MVGSVFITGASGFIGGLLVSSLAAREGQIWALVRRPIEQGQPGAGAPTWVVGDLLDPESYLPSLAGIDTVVHLAAATGKAAPSIHHSTNVGGTRELLDACKTAGIRRFLYVSTIAAKYADQRFYSYAQSKARAETLVRDSGIPNTILRPTIVFGPASPNWQALMSLARLPLIPLPASGRARVQPILVDDLVRSIEVLLDEGRFEGDTLEIGGPTVMPLAELVKAIHKRISGKEPTIIPMPLATLRACLALVEPFARPFMPITAGQLALFANDSTVSPNWLHESLKTKMCNMEDAIDHLIPRPQMATKVGLVSADREAEIFTRYLLGKTSNDYIRQKYREAILARGLADDRDFSNFDRVTVQMARRHIVVTRFADAYCSIFRRHGALRRKLVLLLAILEHAHATAPQLDRPPARGPVGTIAHVARLGLAFGISAFAGAILLAPLQVLLRMKNLSRRNGEAA